jgi:hypothetical protein
MSGVVLGAPPDATAVPRIHLIRNGTILAETSAGTRYLVDGGAAAVAASAATAALAAFPIAPAVLAIPSRSVVWQLAAKVIASATVPVSEFTFALFPITGYGGTTTTNSITVGSVIAASEAKVAAPEAGTAPEATSSAYFELTAGDYAIACTNSAKLAAGAQVRLQAILRQKWTAA